jgi:signal transduction histidine kinase
MKRRRANRGPGLKMTAVVVWLITTLSLAGWWLIYGLQQIDRISALNDSSAQEIVRRHRMLVSEGAFLFALLLVGGIALLYLLRIEMRRSRATREFFAAFTHDLKTSLASLRLQAESLEEDLKDSPQARISRRLVKDTVRLELQLDNSLFIADTEMGHLHFEDVDVNQVLSGLRHYWPELDVRLHRDCWVRGDVRAIESVFKNLLQNAVVHGKASKVEVRCEPIDGAHVAIDLHDNGIGFSGDFKRLGQMFVRQTSTSGSGIGLYLARQLTMRMDGDLQFVQPDTTNPHGFRVRIQLPGRTK